MSTAYATNTSLPPPPGGLKPGELAPLSQDGSEVRDKQQQDSERRQNFVPLDEWLVNVSRKIESLNADTELERLRLISKMRKFYAGDQVLHYSKTSNRWESRKKPGDALYVDPVLSAFVDTNVATRMKSRPKVRVLPRATERVDKTEAARYAEELYTDAARQLFTASVRMREHKNLELSGETYSFLYFDKGVDGTEVKMPVVEARSVVPKHRVWECPACDAVGKLGEDGADDPEGPMVAGQLAAGTTTCPKCGYGKIKVVAADPFDAQVVVGFREVPAGDVCAAFPDPLSVKVIGATDKIADALAITWDSLVVRGVLEEHYPDVAIPSSGTLPIRLQYEQELKEGQAGESGSWGDDGTNKGGEQFELLHLRRVWLSPLLFGGYRYPKDTTLRGGKVIPKDTPLKDVYPGGMYYCHVSKVVLDQYEQSIGSCWSHCQNITGDGFHGLGSWDLIPLQEMKNELVSMQFAAEMYDSLPITLYRPSYFDPKKAPNTPGTMTPVFNLDDDKPLSHAADRMAPGNHTSNAAKLGEQLAGSMQNRYGSFSTGGGAPDVKASGTATGIAILQEQSVGRMGPSLALQAEMEVERAYQILELRQKNWPDEMYSTLDRKVGGDAGRWFREADIRRDFRVEVVPNSWWPQTEASRRVDFAEYANVAGALGLTQDPQVAEALFKRAGELFGRGIELERFQTDRVEARVRLERLRQVAEFLERESGVPVYDQSGRPAESMVELALEQADLVPELPGKCVNAILDRHNQYVQAYSEWLLTSEGRDSSPFVRAVVNGCIKAHYEGKLEQAQYFGALKAQAQIPDKAAQIVSNELDAEQQQGIQAEQAQGQLAAQSQAQELEARGMERQALIEGAAAGAVDPREAVAIRGEMLAQDEQNAAASPQALAS